MDAEQKLKAIHDILAMDGPQRRRRRDVYASCSEGCSTEIEVEVFTSHVGFLISGRNRKAAIALNRLDAQALAHTLLAHLHDTDK